MAQFFDRVEPTGQLRNHIAHGLLRIGLAEDRKTPVLTLSLPRDLDGSNSPDAQHLNSKLITGDYRVLLRAEIKRTLQARFATLNDFLIHWSQAERKQVVLDEHKAVGNFHGLIQQCRAGECRYRESPCRIQASLKCACLIDSLAGLPVGSSAVSLRF
jgi:hypothetical protein